MEIAMPSRAGPGDNPAPCEDPTRNTDPSDPGRIDLIMREGSFASRSNFIRQAIRARLDGHASEPREAAGRIEDEHGVRRCGVDEPEALRDSGGPLQLRTLRLAAIAPDVTAGLARAAIGSLTVLSTFGASPAVRKARAVRIR
jgi:Arc/MetJ-type ribon-helix-helix transcriptional regulator